jgi:hypothetical protein
MPREQLLVERQEQRVLLAERRQKRMAPLLKMLMEVMRKMRGMKMMRMRTLLLHHWVQTLQMGLRLAQRRAE